MLLGAARDPRHAETLAAAYAMHRTVERDRLLSCIVDDASHLNTNPVEILRALRSVEHDAALAARISDALRDCGGGSQERSSLGVRESLNTRLRGDARNGTAILSWGLREPAPLLSSIKKRPPQGIKMHWRNGVLRKIIPATPSDELHRAAPTHANLVLALLFRYLRQGGEPPPGWPELARAL